MVIQEETPGEEHKSEESEEDVEAVAEEVPAEPKVGLLHTAECTRLQCFLTLCRCYKLGISTSLAFGGKVLLSKH